MHVMIAAMLAAGLVAPGPPAGCGRQTNDQNFRLPDAGSPVSSVIDVTGCAGNASASLKVEVLVKHPFRGDIRIDLVTPSGREHRLKNSNSQDGKDDVDETFTVNASGEPNNGRWTLRVQDRSEADTGFLDRWTLTAG